MKYSYTLILFFYLLNLTAQNANNYCTSAQLYCPNYGLIYSAGVNSGSAFPGPNYGCLGSQPNPVWFYLKIASSGSLAINMWASNDIDFICYGPFNSLNNACNNLTAGNIVSCSYSGSASETLTIPSGLTGQYYLFMVTNFSNQNQNINLNQIGGTASIDCTNLPLTVSYSCGASSATITGQNSSLSNMGYTLQPGLQTSPTPTFAVAPSTATGYTLYCSGVNSQSMAQSFSGTVLVNFIGSNTPTIVAANTTPTICAGQAATLTVSGVSSYTWSDGTVNNVIIVTPTVTTSYTVVADSSSGCTDTAVVTQVVSLCTKNREFEFGESIKRLYPVPAAQVFFIETETFLLNEGINLRLFDVLGIEFPLNYRQTQNGTFEVDVSGFVNGQYVLCFITWRGKYYRKIIIQN